MNLNDVWRHVSSRIGFYTKETSGDIPDIPGIYAWFLPLFLPRKDYSLTDYLEMILSYTHYDAANRGPACASGDVRFNWENIRVMLSKQISGTPNQPRSKVWDSILANPNSRDSFALALMQSSILMPPLYVGRSGSLKDRYWQHVEGRGDDKNDFHNRFSEYSKGTSFPFKLRVEDLLFVCISTGSESQGNLKKEPVSDLLEFMMHRVAMPPFSDR